MLSPIAEALGTSLPVGMPVYFSLQGEMGATVFRRVAAGPALCKVFASAPLISDVSCDVTDTRKSTKTSGHLL